MSINELIFKIIWVIGGIVFSIVGTLIVLTPTLQDENTMSMVIGHIEKIQDYFAKERKGNHERL